MTLCRPPIPSSSFFVCGSYRNENSPRRSTFPVACPLSDARLTLPNSQPYPAHILHTTNQTQPAGRPVNLFQSLALSKSSIQCPPYLSEIPFLTYAQAIAALPLLTSLPANAHPHPTGVSVETSASTTSQELPVRPFHETRSQFHASADINIVRIFASLSRCMP